jgi:hypothetical protein
VSRRLATLAATVALATVAAVAVPRAEAVVVAVRVESSEAPAALFDGSVDTLPHAVDGGDGSGAHPCTGSPGSLPAPTATGALDDALRGAGISWRGNWNPDFRDFFIDRIGPFASQSPDRYWSLTVNGVFSAGGCLTRVAAGDSIRFFYGPLFGSPPPSPPSAAGSPPGASAGSGASQPDEAGASRKALRRIASAAAGFLRGHGGVGEGWARLALSLRGNGDPAAAAGGLISAKLGSQQPDGSFDHDVNATALAIVALDRIRPRAAARAAAWLIAIQSPGGGFGYRPAVAPDVDTTGLVSWALALENKQAATLRAADFIRSAQAPDGGFPTLPGGISNAQSTGLATIALRVSGVGSRRTLSDGGLSPLDYLASLARPNGSIAYRRHSAPTPIWTTSQALLGLTSKARLLDLEASDNRGGIR